MLNKTFSKILYTVSILKSIFIKLLRWQLDGKFLILKKICSKMYIRYYMGMLILFKIKNKPKPLY